MPESMLASAADAALASGWPEEWPEPPSSALIDPAPAGSSGSGQGKRRRLSTSESCDSSNIDLAEHGKDVMAPGLEAFDKLVLEVEGLKIEDAGAEGSARPQPSPAQAPASIDPTVIDLEAEVEAAAAGVRLAPGLLHPQQRLFAALSDERLVGMPLYQTLRGRARLKAHFATLRATGAGGAALVRRAVQFVSRALLAPLPPGAPESRTEAAAEAIVDRLHSFVRATTTELVRIAWDLYELPWPTAKGVLQRANDLSLPFKNSPGLLRPKAVHLTALILDLYDQRDKAVGSYFEAWAELRKRGQPPSALEAVLILDLTHTLFHQYSVRTAVHVLEQAYALEGDSDFHILLRARLVFLKGLRLVFEKDVGGAIRQYDQTLAILATMSPELRGLHAWWHLAPGMLMGFRGNVVGFFRYWTRAVQGLAALDDPAAPELDIVHPFMYGVNKVVSAKVLSRVLSVIAAPLRRADRAERSPAYAHVRFQLAKALELAGKAKQAAESFEAALKIYASPKFAHVYPPDCPRVQQATEALRRLRPGALSPRSPLGGGTRVHAEERASTPPPLSAAAGASIWGPVAPDSGRGGGRAVAAWGQAGEEPPPPPARRGGPRQHPALGQA